MQGTYLSIPETQLPRVVILGGGFGGLKAAQLLRNKPFQVVMIDRNDYHQFQPLFYQVAMSGLEPSNVVFPLRRVFHKSRNTHFRVAEVLEIDTAAKCVHTNQGMVRYDHLLLAMGAGTHFYGNGELEQNAVGMKSVSESLYLRNRVLQMLEEEVAALDNPVNIDIAIAGGGPTGVELAGSLAEMKKMMFPRDYPEIDFSMMKILLIEGGNRLLPALDPKSSERAMRYLTKLGVEVRLNSRIMGYQDHKISLADGQKLPARLLIWAAGVKAVVPKGIPESCISKTGRILTDDTLRVVGLTDVYCIGDQAQVAGDEFPNGHPQVAQPAIQQGKLFARNLLRKEQKPFRYKDLGSMATVGRNLAVAEFWGLKLGGFPAWCVWMAVHLMAILGVRNRFFIFWNWLWNYVTYDQSLRLLIKPFVKEKKLISGTETRD